MQRTRTAVTVAFLLAAGACTSTPMSPSSADVIVLPAFDNGYGFGSGNRDSDSTTVTSTTTVSGETVAGDSAENRNGYGFGSGN